MRTENVDIAVHPGGTVLPGELALPDGARGVVVFARGGGRCLDSTQDRVVAAALHAASLATLLVDLHTADEPGTGPCFDIGLLASRLRDVVDRTAAGPETAELPIGLYATGTGAAASLMTAACRPVDVRAVVSCGGRPDLACAVLTGVRAPTLLLVGGADRQARAFNELALRRMPGQRSLRLVPGATGTLTEPGALDRVARRAVAWFTEYLVLPDDLLLDGYLEPGDNEALSR